MVDKLKILIPARGGSKRIPNKNIIDVCGNPLISYTIKECKKITNEVYVSSDSSEILDISKKYGAKTIIRPEKLSTDFTRTEDVIEHFILNCNNMNTLVLVQATSPLLKAEYIMQGIDKLKNYDSIISVMEDTPFYWNSKGNPINFKLQERGRTQDREIWYRENGAFYITSVKKFMNNKILQNGHVGFVSMDKYHSVDIDNYDDLELVKSLLK